MRHPQLPWDQFWGQAHPRREFVVAGLCCWTGRHHPPPLRRRPWSIPPTVAIWHGRHGGWLQSLITGLHRAGYSRRRWLLQPWSSCGNNQTRGTSIPCLVRAAKRWDICPGRQSKPCSQHGRRHRGASHCSTNLPILPSPHGAALSARRNGGASAKASRLQCRMARHRQRGMQLLSQCIPHSSTPAWCRAGLQRRGRHRSPTPTA